MDDKTVVVAEETPVIEAVPPVSEDQGNDLRSRLSAVTERKNPGVVEVAPSKKYWDVSDDDFDVSVKKDEKKSSDQIGENEKKSDSPTTVAKTLTKEAKNAAAGSAVGALDLLNKVICNPILNYKFKKKVKKSFTEKDINLIEEKIATADDSDLDEKELRIKRRLDSILQKIETKRAGIPFTKDEKDEMTEAFKAYSETTGESLPPGLWLGISISTIMGKRVVDMLTD